MIKKEVKSAPETLTCKSLRRTKTLLNLQSLRAMLIDPFLRNLNYTFHLDDTPRFCFSRN